MPVSLPVLSPVDVRDFGATAGDATNDTAAFEQAANNAGPGEAVWVPKSAAGVCWEDH